MIMNIKKYVINIRTENNKYKKIYRKTGILIKTGVIID